MNIGLVRYGVSAVTATIVGVFSFSFFTDKLGFRKHKKEVNFEDIPESEIEPDFDEEE